MVSSSPSQFQTAKTDFELWMALKFVTILWFTRLLSFNCKNQYIYIFLSLNFHSLIIKWISWCLQAESNCEFDVQMFCLSLCNWGYLISSILLVDLRILRLHVTPLPVRLRLWFHRGKVRVHGPKWQSHRWATRRWDLSVVAIISFSSSDFPPYLPYSRDIFNPDENNCSAASGFV